jgi:hypothetical protein
MRIALFYNAVNPYGGWVTFTSHLIDSLESQGHQVELFKTRPTDPQTGIMPRTEMTWRPFGYSKSYRNVNIEAAKEILKHRVGLIVASGKKWRDFTTEMLAHGAKLVVHDPTELKNLPDNLDHSRCIVVRKSGRNHLPKATFIAHPYVRQFNDTPHKKPVLCVSVSRIDDDKHTDIILGANALIKNPKKHVKIYGFENRLYSQRVLMPEFPDWVQSKVNYPREKDAALNILRDARYMADMSLIVGDGGGTQYTFLEAWDANTTPIIQEKWLRPDDEMKDYVNCITVRDRESLARLLKRPPGNITHNFSDHLAYHAPFYIVPEYISFLQK